MKLLLTGDINFRGIEDLDHGKASRILQDVLPYLQSADFVIPNFECPFGRAADYTPIRKSGPNLICADNGISFLQAMHAYAVTLANNHIGDYGDRALAHTLQWLDENQARRGRRRSGRGLCRAPYRKRRPLRFGIIGVRK